jgi:hypothetical protein
MRFFYALFLTIFATTLTAVGVQMQFEPIPKGRLKGVVQPESAPVFSLESAINGSYQKLVEEWLMKRSGLWSYLVRADSQLNYLLFSQISSNYTHSVLLGKDDFLYEKEYVFGYNKFTSVSDEKLETLADNLQKLQKLLETRGIGFALLVSANKAELYPENIPSSFIDSTRSVRKTAYEKLIPRLEARRINLLDGQRYFEERKTRVPYRYFSHTGTHWNDVAACMIASELGSLMQAHFGKKMRNFSCSPVKLKDVPRKPDRDLVEICNLWDQSALYHPTAYPVTKTIAETGAFRPKILIVGSSFVWPLLRFFEYHRVYREANFYYYYKSNRSYPNIRRRKIDRSTIDWSSDVFSHEMIIIEINQVAVENAGFGFIEDAISALEAAS